MKNDLTERQKEILDYISEYINEKGYPPSYREIGNQFEIKSTFGVKRHIDAFIKKGYLTSENNQSRSLSLVNSDKNNSTLNDNTVSIPLVGRVAAGYPILAEENIEDFLTLDQNLLGIHTNSFALKVRGDSMIDAGIFEGDIIVAEPAKEVKRGDIIVALLGDEATLKRYEVIENEHLLVAENKKYAPIIVTNREDFTILGKLKAIIRIYN